MNSFLEEFTTDSLYIKFKPLRNAEGDWDGEIDITAIVHDDNGLEHEELTDMLQVVHMVCASVRLFEENDDIREKARAIVEDAFANPDSEYLFEPPQEETVKKPTITTEGNVVTLNFKND